MSEKRIAYKMLKKSLFILTGKKVNQLPNNHVVMEVLEDLQDYAYRLLKASNPDSACQLYITFLNKSIDNINSRLFNLIEQKNENVH